MPARASHLSPQLRPQHSRHREHIDVFSKLCKIWYSTKKSRNQKLTRLPPKMDHPECGQDPPNAARYVKSSNHKTSHIIIWKSGQRARMNDSEGETYTIALILPGRDSHLIKGLRALSRLFASGRCRCCRCRCSSRLLGWLLSWLLLP